MSLEAMEVQGMIKEPSKTPGSDGTVLGWFVDEVSSILGENEHIELQDKRMAIHSTEYHTRGYWFGGDLNEST